MNNEGLYIRLLANGTIKRRLVTILGEVPLEDTTVAEELIDLCDTNNVPMYQEIKEIWAHRLMGRKSDRSAEVREKAG